MKNLNKKILTLFIIILISTCGLNCVSAEEVLNESEIKIKTASEEKTRIGETVKSNENGHYNITFNDGYSGYCISYGKNEAEIGDDFTVQDTSKAVNNNNGETIGNYLKVFFTDYYDLAKDDKVKTQHYIWALSDDFEGWRVDQDIIKDIKDIAKTKIVPDNGATLKINDTTNAVFYFEVLKSASSGNQNYFAYRIDYETIINDIANNTGSDNTIPGTSQPYDENNSAIGPGEQNNNTPQFSKLNENKLEKMKNSPSKSGKNNVSHYGDEQNINLSKYPTGNPWLIILVILIIAVIGILHYTRD